MSQYNLKSPAVKRLMREAEELRYPTAEYFAQPLEDNLFEWHFTLCGPPNTEFDGGIYHGRITLPPEYPMKPPSIILLTPNGRFETNKKICLSISGYHPESWQPSWSIRTALLALIGFLPTHGNGAIGSLDYTPEERKALALKSQNWKCPQCGLIRQYLVGKSCDSNKEGYSLKSAESPIPKVTSPFLKSEPTKSQEVEETISGETKRNIPSNATNSFENNIAATFSTTEETVSFETENILRPRQPNSSELENAAAISSHSNSRSSGSRYCWSSRLIWVMVIILCLLIFRRLIGL